MVAFNLILGVTYFLLFNFLVNTNAAVQDECYYSNPKTDETWKMVWQDEFESDQLSNNWKVDHATKLSDKCQVQYIVQTNCHSQENVWINNGLLVLMAKQEKYADRNFTGAMITTEKYFTHGRYEIRAKAPSGEHLSVGFYTNNDNDKYWPESGQINIMSVKRELYNDRGFYPNGIQKYRTNALKLSKHFKSFNHFHVYAVEWDEEKIQFFFDDLAGPALFWNDTFSVEPWQQLRLMISVLTEVENATKFEPWKCPALMVDYVRVYEKVQLDNLKFNEKEIKSKQCADKTDLEIQEHETVGKKICAYAEIGKRWKGIQNKLQSSEKSPTESLEKQINYLIYVTIIMLIIIVILVVYRFIIPRKVDKSNDTSSTENEMDHIYHYYTEIHE